MATPPRRGSGPPFRGSPAPSADSNPSSDDDPGVGSINAPVNPPIRLTTIQTLYPSPAPANYPPSPWGAAPTPGAYPPAPGAYPPAPGASPDDPNDADNVPLHGWRDGSALHNITQESERKVGFTEHEYTKHAGPDIDDGYYPPPLRCLLIPLMFVILAGANILNHVIMVQLVASTGGGKMWLLVLIWGLIGLPIFMGITFGVVLLIGNGNFLSKMCQDHTEWWDTKGLRFFIVFTFCWTFGFGMGAACTQGRLNDARYFASPAGTKTIDCFTNANQDINEPYLNYVFLAEPSWKVMWEESWMQKVSAQTYSKSYWSYCVAPIKYTGLAPTCQVNSPFNFWALCYGGKTRNNGKASCGPKEAAACSWQYPGNMATLRRVFKGRYYQSEYGMELSWYQKALKLGSRPEWTNQDPKLFEWDAYNGPPQYMDDKIAHLNHIHVIIAAVSWSIHIVISLCMVASGP
eukprot:gene10932-3296_t